MVGTVSVRAIRPVISNRSPRIKCGLLIICKVRFESLHEQHVCKSEFISILRTRPGTHRQGEVRPGNKIILKIQVELEFSELLPAEDDVIVAFTMDDAGVDAIIAHGSVELGKDNLPQIHKLIGSEGSSHRVGGDWRSGGARDTLGKRRLLDPGCGGTRIKQTEKRTGQGNTLDGLDEDS